jgi:AcrR family transcriptional regulator
MAAIPDPVAAPARLPRGRHRLTREEVAASQRGRLLFAVAAAVADKGYASTTVADVVERANVSRRTFYEQFGSLEECFLAAFDTAVEIVLGGLAAASADVPEGDWRALLRSDLETYMDVLASEPQFARALHLEVLGAGPAALEQRARIHAIFTERTRRLNALARRADRSLPKLPDELFELHTGGLDELVRECLRTRGPEALPELVEPCVRATRALFGDHGR